VNALKTNVNRENTLTQFKSGTVDGRSGKAMVFALLF